MLNLNATEECPGASRSLCIFLFRSFMHCFVNHLHTFHITHKLLEHLVLDFKLST